MKKIQQAVRLPHWLQRNKNLRELHHLRQSLRCQELSTVCEEARCPNIAECFARKEATFLILGDVCTRGCAFCSVSKGREPGGPDAGEPGRVAAIAASMELKHVVITSVTRDDLPDQGAQAFADTIAAVRAQLPQATIEVLTPDFRGETGLLDIVIAARPDVFGHNVETVEELYARIRPQASLPRSLAVLRHAVDNAPGLIVKSGFMVGLGEDESAIRTLIGRLASTGLHIVTIGQYLRPTRAQVPVAHYWEPEYFTQWARLAKDEGIRYAAAGPLVRSSYRAREILETIRIME